MFWDRVASVYDLFEDVYNRKVYRGTGKVVASEITSSDSVLECACGTGAISVFIAPVCKHLTATDFSEGMLRQTAKKVRHFNNVKVAKADMTNLKCKSDRFDVVVAGNVIHLLDDPIAALNELMRVSKPSGKVIIPTYINISNGKPSLVVKLLEKAGLKDVKSSEFKRYGSSRKLYNFNIDNADDHFRRASDTRSRHGFGRLNSPIRFKWTQIAAQ